MFYYFAYGSCMNLDSLSQTLGIDVKDCLIGKSYLHDYKLLFNYPSMNGVNHYCNVDQNEGSTVEGTLFYLPESVLEALREREGFSQGRYHEEKISIECEGKAYENVMLYRASLTSHTEGFPGDRYLGLFKGGLSDASVSDEYKQEVIERLERLKHEFELKQPSEESAS
ncbi:gamma-glutamylcyclotransferase family protein [Vibrio sp. Of7-15]|uniref:gamma-glutamylcyclotransferase family protein n=1 Tax=Vibrio sp. Of7-15 TaxID=2724879 RepID=UPI0023B77E51|nr:gamma-glutamylcyclotransferase family protein [Vibrio sp. Of7-15]